MALGREKIVTWIPNAERLRAAALVAAILVLSLPGAMVWAQGGQGARAGGGPRAPRPQARYSQPRQRAPQRRARAYQAPNRPPRMENQQRPVRSFQAAPQARAYPQRGNIPQPNERNAFPNQNRFAPEAVRPAYPNAANGRAAYPGGARPGYNYPAFPPGHLGAWLNQNRNLPFQGQEQLLRNDPSFRRLPPADQQRLVRQLRQVDQLPPQQRERRLEREEAIEHMSPQDRMNLYASNRQFAGLPADRKALVKRAFQDLRGVPIDQRQTVLNSERYQSVFTPQERNILGNLLRAEPYVPPR
jgi:hypothetical protein